MARSSSQAPLRSVVAVLSHHQGSGVLIGRSTVLTCAHVVGAADTARVAVPGIGGELLCRLVWSDEGLDAALLHITRKPEALTQLPRMSTLATDRPLTDCEIIGFPRIQRYGGGRKLDLDQYTGTILPMAGLIRRTMVFEFDRPPASEPADGTSPLAGLSGAPVFADDGLLGIVQELPRGRGHRRVECLPLQTLAMNQGFLEAYGASTGHPPPRLTELSSPAIRDLRFEREYAEAVGAAYRRTRIFGLDELRKRDSEWDLDTAYVSLEARPRQSGGHDGRGAPPQVPVVPEGPEAGGAVASVPKRIDELLADRPRVLLRGEAGAGKTTLMWWLAAHASAGTLGPRLDQLNGLVPFVVPLRTLRARGGTFPTPSQLHSVAQLMADDPPEGWAGRVLKAGRALLLLDGLDEMPKNDREEAHEWLSGLLARFPGTRCVVTVRPLAVEPDWLKSEGFEELSLLPMTGSDIHAFVAAWHRAARLDGDDGENLDDLERELAQQFEQNRALSDLARTPLLCAVICALHRLRQGFLPETRWALYQSALQMLLGNRDKFRKIDAPEGISMTVEEHLQLLQRIAVWLVRGGQAEFTREQALHQLKRTLPGMPRVGEQGTPEVVLNHLLNRSGLLQERGDDDFQFAHRTFQDFLAAKEFVEGDHIQEALKHAYEQQWQDVLLLAAGHCSRRELTVLVNGLMTAGSSLGTQEGRRRTELYVLAALCAQHAAWLDSATLERVRTGIRSVVEPRNNLELHLLARLGPYVLPLLPSPAPRPMTHERPVVELINEIGGADAIPYARRFAEKADGSSNFASSLAGNWANYPAGEYAREVLTRLDLTAVPLFITNREQLAQLPVLSHARHLDITGDISAAELEAHLDGHSIETIGIADNKLLTDLTFLRCCGSELKQVAIRRCPGVESLAFLPELDALEVVDLDAVRVSAVDVGAMARISRLRSVFISYPSMEEEELNLTPLRAVAGLKLNVSGLPKRRIIGYR
ncbi:NACHT domain-containing protein [Streptomyces sp. NPDC019890]|uniref:NACHT domain-containing protein n=1 Tax=Streptomyces sp. NPDC019890 TaxID=3365064 RepID=UPI00384E026D